MTTLGYAVVLAADGQQALELFEDGSPDIVLLDILLPDMSGFDLCRQFRRRTDIPIIMLSAIADEQDIVQARMGVAIRHWEHARHIPGRPTRTVERIEIGPYVIDLAACTVAVEGMLVHLALREFDLFAHLASAPGRVCTKEELMNDLWGKSSPQDGIDYRTLDTHIYRLRTKLEKDPAHPTWIMSVRGVGFLLNNAPHRDQSPHEGSGL